MIISQDGNLTFIVTQTPHKVEVVKVVTEGEVKKDGEGEAKKETS